MRSEAFGAFSCTLSDVFGNFGDSDSSYWRANNNVGHTPSNYYFHAIGIKLNTTALGGAGLAVRDWGLKWRNGSGSYWWTNMEAANSDSGISASTDVWSLGGCTLKNGNNISNGTSYSHSSDGSNNFASNSQYSSTPRSDINHSSIYQCVVRSFQKTKEQPGYLRATVVRLTYWI